MKASAMMVIDSSQAAGRPKINVSSAHTAFKKELAANLGLNENTLQPLAGSAMKSAPDYVLMVYNGDSDYAIFGGIKACKYQYTGGTLTTTYPNISGFPYRFGVNASDVVPGGGGTYNVTLDMPGAVAVINTSVRKVLGRDALSPVRYAAAKIVCPAGTCGP
ncbi:MAG: hypothetical protein H5T99_07195 [Moorella sp. (in: Bacteria)]|nr:hypothetical protein [Moorella sp. (in: firmicutes)]